MKARFFYVFWTLLGLAALCLLYGIVIEPRRLVLRHVTIESASYKGQPLEIAFLSDIHIGGTPITPNHVAKIVARVNAQAPDIVLLGGDYIDGHLRRSDHSPEFNEEIEKGLEALGKLTAKQGVFAVLGNHDNWYDAAWVTARLTHNGNVVLENQAVNLAALCIVGMADFDTATSLSSTYAQCAEETRPLLLSHSPDSFRYLRSDTVLALAGHTHGGQINLPLIGRRVTATRSGEPLAYGLKDVGGVPAFVTSGIGTSILPARFRAPPEIVLIDLRQK